MPLQENKAKQSGFFTYIKTKGRLWLLLGGAVCGVLLLLFGGMSQKIEQEPTVDTVAQRIAELEAYELRVEAELTALCASVSGVRDVELMVSLAGGYAVKYTEDADGDPASVGSGSSEEPLFNTVAPPAILGVGVVCHGGEKPAVQQTLVELISTTLGIPANRVFVAGK